jgi:hypothetical protein
MKKQMQTRTGFLLQSSVLAFLMFLGCAAPEAGALSEGSAPRLVNLKIAPPAGDTVEISSNNESLRSVALEVTIEADQAGVDYFELRFESPDGKVAVYEGYGDSPARRDPLVPQDKTRQTYVLGGGQLSKWRFEYSDSDFVRTLDTPGKWTLSEVSLYARNETSTEYRKGELPAGLPSGFEVTRWFTTQPAASSVLVGALLSLTPGLDGLAVSAPTYQWYRNGVAVAGANGRVFSKTAAPADSGLYYLEVRSGGTKVRSDAVAVSVRNGNVVAARTAINNQNAAEAKKRAAAALALNPTGGEELFVSALSELFGVLSDSRTGAAISSFGASAQLRFPFPDFGWAGAFPAAANSATFNTWLLSVFLPAVEKAEASLEKINDQRFVTTVGASDFGGWGTSSSAFDTLLVDYGDIQALRVGCNAISTISRLWTSMDTSVRPEAIRTLLSQGKLSIEALLKDYPKLLAAASGGAANQSRALDSLGKMAAAYLKFSNFIYNPAGTSGAATRYIDGDLNLINVQRQFAEDGVVSALEDPILRDYAQNIIESIAQGQRDFIANVTDELGVGERYPVNLKALKARPAGLRSAVAAQNVVPKFTRNLAGGVVSNSSLSGFLPSLDAGLLVGKISEAEPQITKALGTREDQSVPVLILTDVPLSGNKVLLAPDSGPVRLSGTVQDESQIGRVVLERTVGLLRDSFEADLEELQPVVVAGKLIRTWRWSLELPFDESGLCAFSIYATDQFNQKSLPKTGSFAVVKAVRVVVNSPGAMEGTLTVTPPIPASGLVETGTSLRVAAVAQPGYLFRLLEVVVDGVPVDDISRASTDVVVTAETVITPQFIANPFPALAGQWTGALAGQMTGASSSSIGAGFVNLTVTKTGAFTLKVVQGRNSFSATGVMDASGSVQIKVPSNFYPYGISPVRNGEEYCSLLLNKGIRFSFGANYSSRDIDGLDSSRDGDEFIALLKAADAQTVAGLQSRRFNAAFSDSPSDGYAGFDMRASGIVLSTGMVNLPGDSTSEVGYLQKTVRYSFSTPLVLGDGRDGAPVDNVPMVKFYAVASPSSICVSGYAFIDGGGMSGEVRTATVSTGIWDPERFPSGPLADGRDPYNSEFMINGVAYIAPKIGQLAPPFSGDQSAFTVNASVRSDGLPYGSTNTMGDLTLSGGRPVFRYRAVAGPNGEAPFVKSATLGFITSTGAFSGSLVTQINGATKTRAYTGVVVRAAGDESGGTIAVGMSSDGLLISFENKN